MNAVNSHLAEKKNIKEARNEWKSHFSEANDIGLEESPTLR